MKFRITIQSTKTNGIMTKTVEAETREEAVKIVESYIPDTFQVVD